MQCVCVFERERKTLRFVVGVGSRTYECLVGEGFPIVFPCGDSVVDIADPSSTCEFQTHVGDCFFPECVDPGEESYTLPSNTPAVP